MKIHLHNTSKFVEVDGVPARVWEGHTEAGIPVSALIVRLACDRYADAAEFERDLRETAPPSVVIDAWPARMSVHPPPLTYDTATPEQVTAARDEARRKLAEADARDTPERRRAGRELLGMEDQDG